MKRAKFEREEDDEKEPTEEWISEGPNGRMASRSKCFFLFSFRRASVACFFQLRKYQSVSVFETKAHGRALVLDSVLQLTEKDEFAYHVTMLVHQSSRC